MIIGDCAAMVSWCFLKKKKKKKKKAKEYKMKNKGRSNLDLQPHWRMTKDGSFECTECGHIQNIILEGAACKECGTWMVARLIKTEEEKDGN